MNNVETMKNHVHDTKGRYIKVATLMVIFMTTVILGIGGLLTYWSFSGSEVLKINNTPFPIRRTGDAIVLDVDFCKNISVNGRVRTSFVSKTREIFLPMGNEQSPKGCTKTEVPILLPKDLPPDTYRVHFRTVYDINPLKRNVINEFESQEFTIE